ncbi:hypothetical protein Nepgr_023093 [Nepenthes gracilis]|uniref:Uncharacterized protein n=1 Tax=Nepenthes gracilis TaxID=150966 RepID=A0AAD3T276_NEPGR|nr:hypothetical protein Nepgr_023093 [Nepenthes gracilis]
MCTGRLGVAGPMTLRLLTVSEFLELPDDCICFTHLCCYVGTVKMCSWRLLMGTPWSALLFAVLEFSLLLLAAWKGVCLEVGTTLLAADLR